MKTLIPEALRKGDTLGIVSPSSLLKPGVIDLGISYLKELGFKLMLGKHIFDADRFLGRKITQSP